MMRAFILVLMVWGLLALSVVATGQDEQKDAGKSFLGQLSPGQHVSLRDENGRYTITTYLGGPKSLPITVVSVANDHVVIRDVTSITETSISIYSIKAIVTVRLEGDK